MFTGYVINLNSHTHRLHQFNQNLDAKFFKRIPAIDKQTLKSIPPQFIFNFDKLEEEIKRPVTLGEIACTLSHILAWKDFSEDSSHSLNDYAVIAEDDIQLCPEFSERVSNIINYVKNIEPKFNIILLHKLGLYQSYLMTDKNTIEYRVSSIIDKDHIDNDGSALYLIRKSYAKDLIKQLINQKPYWLADHFSKFGGNHIGMVQPFLGRILPSTPSSLEHDRELARNKSLARQ